MDLLVNKFLTSLEGVSVIFLLFFVGLNSVLGKLILYNKKNNKLNVNNSIFMPPRSVTKGFVAEPRQDGEFPENPSFYFRSTRRIDYQLHLERSFRLLNKLTKTATVTSHVARRYRNMLQPFRSISPTFAQASARSLAPTDTPSASPKLNLPPRQLQTSHPKPYLHIPSDLQRPLGDGPLPPFLRSGAPHSVWRH